MAAAICVVPITGAALMGNWNVCVTLNVEESFTCTDSETVPALTLELIVPDSSPELLIVKLLGSPVADHVSVPAPPVAANCKETLPPTDLGGSGEDVVIASGAISDSWNVAEAVAPLASLMVMTLGNVPDTVPCGLPDKVSVDPLTLRLNPGASVDAADTTDSGSVPPVTEICVE